MPPIKPGRWTANPAEIDPQFLGLWRDLILAVPLWEGSGVPYDILSRKGATVASALTWAVGEGGMGVDTRSVANRMAWDGVYNFATDEAASIFVYASFADNATTKLVLGADDFGSYIGLSVDLLSVDDWLYGGNDDAVVWDGDGLTQRVTASYDGDRVLIVSNGTVHTDTTGVSRTTRSDAVVLSSGQTDTTSAIGLFYVFYVWKRGLTLQEAQLLEQDPFGLIRPVPIVTEADAVSGAGAVAEQSDDATGAGNVLVSGSGAISEQGDDATGTGTILVSGSGAISEQADDASGAGNVLVSGAGAVAEQPDDATGAGTSGVLGSGAITEQPDNATGIGTSGAVATRIVAVSVIGRPRASAISKRRIKVTDRNRVISSE